MNCAGATAVVFAYHDVGVRAIETLLARGIKIELVVTHRDDPRENRWFASVADCACRYGIETIRPARKELPGLVDRLGALSPEFIFAFYYRHLLPRALLETARRGALNLHGSLLPRYRGRAPVNWAVLNGESETGASLHYMAARADAGDLVDREAVPILPNDTAAQVMAKVALAGEKLLWRRIPALLQGAAPRTPLDLAAGNYCGRRQPADGRIDWRQGAWAVHNLIRAVAPPYPGAFTSWRGQRLALLHSHFRGETGRGREPCIYAEAGRLYCDCVDGRRFQLLECALDGTALTVDSLAELTRGRSLLPGAET